MQVNGIDVKITYPIIRGTDGVLYTEDPKCYVMTRVVCPVCGMYVMDEEDKMLLSSLKSYLRTYGAELSPDNYIACCSITSPNCFELYKTFPILYEDNNVHK